MTDACALFQYLDALRENNNRTWFATHRAEFDTLRADFTHDLQRLINAMAAAEPSLRYLSASDALYRIYRDTRFSNDKTPYKTYFSALISPNGRHYDGACWYLHVGAEECAIYGGVWTPEGKILRKLRKAIIDNIEEFRALTQTPEIEREFPGWYGRKLKTAPQGYDRNHPDIDLLRLTEYGKCHYFEREFFNRSDWPERAAVLALLLKPMNDFLNFSINED